MSPKVNVVMPVFRGGGIWERTLESLQACRHLLGDLVVSFDGPDRDLLASRLTESWGKTLRPFTLVTPRPMTARQHTNWYLKQQPISEWADDTLVLQWLEDDLICPHALREALIAVADFESPLLFGPWQRLMPDDNLCSSHPESVFPKASVINQSRIALELAKWARHGEATSVTGITTTMAVLRSYYLGLRISPGDGQFTLDGYRAEYFLATQPEVKNLIRMSIPLVGIHQHAHQENRITTQSTARQDEALYYLWLMITRQPMRFTDRSIACVQFLRKLLLTLPNPPNLPRATVTFWRFRRGA